MTHKIQFILNGKLYEVGINYCCDLAFGDTITLLPELTDEDKKLFTAEELIQLDNISYRVDAVGKGGIVKFKEVKV